jgi:succinate dehydrogenase / fumarate reductase cytochrome b subunit
VGESIVQSNPHPPPAPSPAPPSSAGFLDRHHFLLRRLHSLTGIVPVGAFLIGHLLTNSSVAWGLADSHKNELGHGGVATFQHEVDFIHSIPFLLIIEVTLWLAIAFHSVLGVVYARSGRSNTRHYGYQANRRYQLQRISGYVGILFILYHIATLRWGWTFLIPGGTRWSAEFAASTLAAALRGGDSGLTPAGIAVSLFYFAGVSLLVFHFANGMWTAAITWGLTVTRQAQARWGYACAGLGAALMLMAWSSLAVLVAMPPERARAVEEKFHRAHAQPESVSPMKLGEAK